MSKLNNRYWLETDDLFNTTGKNTERFFKGILATVYPFTNSQLRTTTTSLVGLKFFPEKGFS